MSTRETTNQLWCAIGAAICAGVLMSGCDQSPGSSGATPSANATYEASRLSGAWGANPYTAQKERAWWLRFQATGTYEAFDGCNSMSGRWSLDKRSGALNLDLAGAVTTTVACLATAHNPVSSVVFDGKKISLYDNNKKLVQALSKRGS